MAPAPNSPFEAWGLEVNSLTCLSPLVTPLDLSFKLGLLLFSEGASADYGVKSSEGMFWEEASTQKEKVITLYFLKRNLQSLG